jgi:hypothetical protein
VATWGIAAARIHHAIIPCHYFDHTDAKSWLGFDIEVLAPTTYRQGRSHSGMI